MVSTMYYSVFFIVYALLLCTTCLKKPCIFGILTFNKLIVGNIR